MSIHILKLNKNNKNLEKEIQIFNQNKNKGKWFVKYYANWCPHCVNMQDHWNKLEKHEVLKENNINIAEIEESYFDKLSHKPDVIGFPTIKLYENGIDEDFKEGRTMESMASFLQKQKSGGYRRSKTAKNKRKIINKGKRFSNKKNIKKKTNKKKLKKNRSRKK